MVSRRTWVGLWLAATLPATAVAAEWPQFHGPNRDNRSPETGLLQSWPEGGPPLVWTATGLGYGFASVAVANGLIYTTGNLGDATVITALDLEGKVRWRAPNGPADKHDHPGTRSTPVVDGDRLYHENSGGDLVCLKAATGKEVWSLNILKTFDGRSPTWGLAESPLVDGNKVICTPGGKNAGVVALDKHTGKTIWVCRGTTEKPGYASPVAIEFGGVRQVVTMMQHSIVGIDADSGRLLWHVPHTAFADETVSTPLFADGRIVVSTLPPGGTQCVALRIDGGRIRVHKVWQSKALANHHGGLVIVDGYVYGADYRGNWKCLDLRRGRVLYSIKGVGKGSLTCADGKLYLVGEQEGLVGLMKASPDDHRLISRFRLPRQGRGPFWAHPVVCAGRLYLRHGDCLYCYNVKAP